MTNAIRISFNAVFTFFSGLLLYVALILKYIIIINVSNNKYMLKNSIFYFENKDLKKKYFRIYIFKKILEMIYIKFIK